MRSLSDLPCVRQGRIVMHFAHSDRVLEFPISTVEDYQGAIDTAKFIAATGDATSDVIPISVILFIDGEVLRVFECHRQGAKSGGTSTRPKYRAPKFRSLSRKSISNAAEKQAAGTIMGERHDNSWVWADDVADDLIEAAGSLRPKMSPPPRPVFAPVPHVPAPALTSGWRAPDMEKVMSLRQYEFFPHRLEQWLANEEV